MLKLRTINNLNDIRMINRYWPLNSEDTISWKDLYNWSRLNHGIIYVWYKRNKPIAIMNVRCWHDIAMISNFEVRPEYKRQGYGSKCFKQIQKLYRTKILLLEIKKHTTLRKFYSKFGMHDLSKSKIYYSEESNIMSSDPNLDSFTVQNYFWNEYKTWSDYFHRKYDKAVSSY